LIRLVVLQHVPFEGPAAIELWAAARGAGLRAVHVYRGEPLPEISQFDMLAVMGGPMSVNDDKRHLWLDLEIELVREAVSSGKIVLGICLGAQMSVLGLQFHLEATPASVKDLLENGAGEIGGGPYEQNPDAIIAGSWHCDGLRPLLDRVLDNLTGVTAKGK
jgi:GMP synthase-like glutamine amidotransferase